jgi:hypothetical protein
MKKGWIIVAVYAACALTISAQQMGAGLDINYDQTRTSTSADDQPLIESDMRVVGAFLFMLNPKTELSAKAGITITEDRDEDLSEPVISSQFGVIGGAALYRSFIQGSNTRFSVGPDVSLEWLFKPEESTVETYRNVAAELGLDLNLDLFLPSNWFLRFSISPVRIAFDHDKRDDLVTNTWTFDTERFFQGATVGVRLLF